MLQGPNLESLSQVAAISGLQVIASGGVSSLVDLERISRIAA